MAKVIKYGDFSGVETDFKQAPVGLYYLRCEDITEKPSKNGDPQVEVIFKPVKDANGKKLKENYGQLWYYAPLDPDASWARRMKELITAFGLKAKSGNLGSIVGKECLGRLREDTDLNGEYRPNIGKLLSPTGTKTTAPVDEDEDEDEELETNGALDAMNRTALKQLIKSEALEIKVLKSMSDEELREAISEVWPPEADEEEDEEEEDEELEDDEEEEEDEVEEDNYDDMSVKALRQECADRELASKGSKPILIARLRTDDQEEPV